MLTTKLSASIALEPIMVKTKKKVMDILRALWKSKCTYISIFLRLFNQKVQPAHLYMRQKYGEQIKSKKLKKITCMHARKPDLLIRKHQI